MLADYRVGKQRELDGSFTQVLAAPSREGLIGLDGVREMQFALSRDDGVVMFHDSAEAAPICLYEWH